MPNIGVDVGKASLECYIPTTNNVYKVPNDNKGFLLLLKYLKNHYKNYKDFVMVFEPTGGYEKELEKCCFKKGIKFIIVHPNKVRNYAKATSLLAKTDKLDCKLISEFANNFSLQPKQNYKSTAEEKLVSLTKRREQLILMKNQEICRLETEQDNYTKKSINQHISYLEEKIKSVNAHIKVLCKDDKEIKDKMDRLISIPVVGTVLATSVICQAPELGNIAFTKLTSLIGLAPFARDSGKFKGRRSIFAGRGHLRKVLYMAAVASLRHNPKLKSFYDHLIVNHKPPKVAFVAVMRKLLAFMHAVIKNNSFWDDNFTIA